MHSRLDVAAVGVKNHKGRQFCKYNIGCVQQPGAKPGKGGTDFKRGPGITVPHPPAGDGPMNIANHKMQHIVLFDLVTRMLKIAPLVNYSVCKLIREANSMR